MNKKAIGVLLIVFFAGGWFYLDYLNKQELKAADEVRQAMVKARAEAQARALALEQAKAKFAAELRAEVSACQANAEKAANDYIAANSKPVRKKPGQSTVPKKVLEEAANMLIKGNADCQLAYDTRLQKGPDLSAAPVVSPISTPVPAPVSSPVSAPVVSPTQTPPK